MKTLYFVIAIASLMPFCLVGQVQAEDPPQFLFQWGSYGTGPGQFINPEDIDVDQFGNVYVSDQTNNRIQKFNAYGKFILEWGSFGSGDGEFYSPAALCADRFGNVYVADRHNNRVQKFTSSGTHLLTWGSYGSGPGQFFQPQGIAVDTDGNVYVCDTENLRVQKFDSTGTYIMTFANGNQTDGIGISNSGQVYLGKYLWGILHYTVDGVYVNGYGCLGSYPMCCDLPHPNDVDVDQDGNVYVSENDRNRVVKMTATGDCLTQFGGFGDGPEQLNQPYGLAVAPNGWVYVAELYNNRIKVFGYPPTSVEPTTWGHIKTLFR